MSKSKCELKSFLNQDACTYRLKTCNIWWSSNQITIFRRFRHHLPCKCDNWQYLTEGSWTAVSRIKRKLSDFRQTRTVVPFQGYCLHWTSYLVEAEMNVSSCLGVNKQGSSENDGYDRSECKVISNGCYNNCCCTN